MPPCKALTRRDVPLPKLSTGVVVRPRTCGNNVALGGRNMGGSATNPQILVFLGDEIRELLPSGDAAASAAAQLGASSTATPPNAEPESFELSTRCLALTGQELRKARHPVYEPTSDGVFFVEGYTIKRLDAANTVSLVAGSELENGCVDGVDGAVRFNAIHSLAADGKGRIFVAEALAIRVLDVSTGEVTTLPGAEPAKAYWTAVTYNTKYDMLIATTPVAVCHVTLSPPAPPCGVDAGGGICSGTSSCNAAAVAPPRIVAGSWGDHGNADGDGTAARFWAIWSVLAAADGVVHIGDCSRLRSLDVSGAITTRMTGAVEGYTLRQMAILPGGQLAVDDFFKQVLIIVSGDGGSAGGGFQPCSEALGGCVAAAATTMAPGFPVGQSPGQQAPTAAAASGLLNFLLASPHPGGSSGGGGQGGGGAANDAASSTTTTSTVTITTRGGRGFVGHRSVLAARSEYFKYLLAAAEGGGCDDNAGGGGGVEVLLPDADPEAFGRLLVYMYTGELVVPDELLHPVAVLARRLKLPAECSAQLTARLLAGVNPGSVVSELVWAERHGLTELAARLQTRLVQWRREVAAAGPEVRSGVSELIAVHPELTVEVMLQLLAT